MEGDNRLFAPLEDLDLSDGALKKIWEGSRCCKVKDLWVLSDKEFCWQMHFTIQEAEEILDKMEQVAEEVDDSRRIKLVKRRREYLMKYGVDYDQYISRERS